MRFLAVVTVIFSLALAAPAISSAAEFHVEGTTGVYTGDATADQLVVGTVGIGQDSFVLTDNGVATVTGGPCERKSSQIVCPVSQVTAIRLDLGDGDDQVTSEQDSTSAPLPLTINGGPGNDLLAGNSLGDTINGGEGNDDIPALGGDDTVDGGPGKDSIRGGDGNDTLNGGAGDDFVNGMNGNDILSGGTGTDTVYGGEGDDTLDFRNGEVDGQEGACDEGNDTVALDPNDRVLEFKGADGATTVEITCEHVIGQTAAPKPDHVFRGFKGNKASLVVDLVEALPATITVELLAGKTVIGKAVTKRKGPRTYTFPKINGAGRKLLARRIIKLKARVTVTDTGGRSGVSMWKI